MMTRTLAAALLALSLSAHAAHAATYEGMSTIPDGCRVTHYSPDDGGLLASCSDGRTVIYDADGNPYPYPGGGTWEAGWYIWDVKS